MYNGLTTADKGALLDAKARGAEWVARDEDDELVAFRIKPHKYLDMELNSDHWERTQFGNYFIVMPSDEPLQFIQWNDPEPVNIDIALAQIAEMEREQTANYVRVGDVTVEVGETTASKPLTWNDAINAMSAKEKARFWVGKGSEMHNQACRYAWAQQTYKKSWDEHYVDKMTELLNSHYNGAQKGAE